MIYIPNASSNLKTPADRIAIAATMITLRIRFDSFSLECQPNVDRDFIKLMPLFSFVICHRRIGVYSDEH